MRKYLLEIYSRIQPPHTYVEVFGGAAALLFAKPPSPVEVYNDVDSGLVNFFRVLRDPEQARQLQELCALTPYSREEYNDSLASWKDELDPVCQAHMWYVVASWSFGGRFGSGWGMNVTQSVKRMAWSSARWMQHLKAFPQLHARVMRVQIEHKDFADVILQYDTRGTLFYLDPPYIPDTRKGTSYEHELTLEDHQRLVDILLSIEGNAMLSGYVHPVYDPLLDSGWHVHRFRTLCYAAGATGASDLQGDGTRKQKQQRIECIWVKRELRLF